MPNSLELAKKVLAANEAVLFGIFGEIGMHPYFPPRAFLNEFLTKGYDPCDQDGRMGRWAPLTVSPEEYRDLLAWWVGSHPGSAEDRLGAACWEDWVHVVVMLWETGGVPPTVTPTAEPKVAPDCGGIT